MSDRLALPASGRYPGPMPGSERRRRLYGGKTEPYKKVWKDGKARRLHRLLAEAKLGRPLRPGEVVHHREGALDREDNLEVYPSQRHHMVVHHYLRREARGIQHLFDLETCLSLLDLPCEGDGPAG